MKRSTRRLIWTLCAAGAVAALPRSAHAVEPAVRAAEAERIAMLADISPSVVAVFGAKGDGGGSGVLITPDGFALSNFHVTSGAGDFMKCGLNDGNLYDAVIVGIDPTGDVALLKLLGRDDFPAARMGNSDDLKLGDAVFAVGNPFLLATDFTPTVTAGIVSGVHRYQYPAGTFLEYTDCIQTDASINPGNSGGPLFNLAGELVGINGRGSFEKRGRVNVGAGYAISINQIKHFLDQLRGGRIVDHATLQATVQTNADGTVTIDQILEQSAAFRRGLREGDELVSFAGRPIRSVNQFKNILGIYPAGWTVPLVYRREGERHAMRVRLSPLHTEEELRKTAERPPESPDQPPEEEPRPGENPRPPRIPGLQAKIEAPKPPEEYKHLFVPKPGFANYYFNELEQNRVLEGLRSFGEFATNEPAWQLAGRTASGEDFVFTLAEKGIGLEQAGRLSVQQLDGSEYADEPPGTGGLLTALAHLRLMLTSRAKGFTDFYYAGSEPLDGDGETVDVLTAVLGSSESRWYFSRQDGALLGFDMALGDDVDECEVLFRGRVEFGKRNLPAVLEVRHAGEMFDTYTIERCQTAGPAQR